MQAVSRPSAAHVHCLLVQSARHFGVGMFPWRLQREHWGGAHEDPLDEPSEADAVRRRRGESRSAGL